MSKWKCDICNGEFNNYHAEGFNNKIYCPLCYYKHEYNNLKQQLSQLQQDKQELENKLDIANKKLDEIKEYADDKREEFNEVIRYYLDDNLIGNEDEVNKLREFRSWFMEILSIIGGE